MTADQIVRIRAAAAECRKAILATLPLGRDADPDTALHMGMTLGELRNLDVLLERDEAKWAALV